MQLAVVKINVIVVKVSDFWWICWHCFSSKDTVGYYSIIIVADRSDSWSLKVPCQVPERQPTFRVTSLLFRVTPLKINLFWKSLATLIAIFNQKNNLAFLKVFKTASMKRKESLISFRTKLIIVFILFCSNSLVIEE